MCGSSHSPAIFSGILKCMSGNSVKGQPNFLKQSGIFQESPERITLFDLSMYILKLQYDNHSKFNSSSLGRLTREAHWSTDQNPLIKDVSEIFQHGLHPHGLVARFLQSLLMLKLPTANTLTILCVVQFRGRTANLQFQKEGANSPKEDFESKRAGIFLLCQTILFFASFALPVIFHNGVAAGTASFALWHTKCNLEFQ